MRVHVGGSAGVPAHGGHVFCEQKNLKMEGSWNVAGDSGKLAHEVCVESSNAVMTG